MGKHLHEKRGITFQEYGALLAVRAMLERGDLTFVKGNGIDCTVMQTVAGGAHLFTMSHPGAQHECGTVGCIGGYMGGIMGRIGIPFGHKQEDSPLYPLFYPDTKWKASQYTWEWITPKVAVQAIDNWLETGRPGWNALVPDKYRYNSL